MTKSPKLIQSPTQIDISAGLHRDAVQLTKEYGIFTLRTCLLLNGGAILAILGLLGSLLGRGQQPPIIRLAEFVFPFYSFGLGLVAAVIAAACGYFNFLYSQMGLGVTVSGFVSGIATVPFAHYAKRAKFAMCAAHVLAIFSILSFAVGAIIVGSVFSRY